MHDDNKLYDIEVIFISGSALSVKGSSANVVSAIFADINWEDVGEFSVKAGEADSSDNTD